MIYFGVPFAKSLRPWRVRNKKTSELMNSKVLIGVRKYVNRGSHRHHHSATRPAESQVLDKEGKFAQAMKRMLTITSCGTPSPDHWAHFNSLGNPCIFPACLCEEASQFAAKFRTRLRPLLHHLQILA